MKKLVTIILMLSMILLLSACGKMEITMQEIYNAGQTEAMLESHQSVSIQNEMDGEVFDKTYLTKELSYEHFPDEEYDWAQFMTDEASYIYSSGDYLRYLYITPDGVTNDFASDRAELCVPVLTADVLEETIASASKKDGRITVNSYFGEELLAEEEGLTSCKKEYVLDAKTHELISATADYVYEDGTTFHVLTEVAYDTESPEMMEVFLKYANQTEDLRKISVVSNPGTKKEISQDFQIPKGLIIDFTYDDAFADRVELYTDAVCTEAYDPYADTNSDIIIYVKWADKETKTPEITLQDLYDATNIPALLEKHDSVYVLYTENGEVYQEEYYSKEYCYTFLDGEFYEMGSDLAALTTNHSYHYYTDNTYAQGILLTPDGMMDVGSIFAEFSEKTIFFENLLNDTITSVTEKDGNIIMTTVSDPEEIEAMKAEGVTVGEEEYMLDASTSELISVKSIFFNEAGEEHEGAVYFTYDEEIPEGMEKLMEYAQQTENMRTITIISNPGTDTEKTESVQVPKGVVAGLEADMSTDKAFTLYTDAACTQIFKEAPDVNSDVTVYIKWDE